MEYKIVTPADANYPKKLKERLGENCPPKLYYHGPLEFLDLFTIATIASDIQIGSGIKAFWDPEIAIMDFESNNISGWYSVLETEMFHGALLRGFAHEKKRYHNFMTLFSAKGLAKETFEDFLLYRFYPPFDKIPVRTEYFRRIKNNDILMLSIVEPEQGNQLRKNIMERNWIACVLADIVYIPWAPKKSKTLALAKRLVEAKIPVFTVDKDLLLKWGLYDNPDYYEGLYKLGIKGYDEKATRQLLTEMGAKLYVHDESKAFLPMQAPIKEDKPPEKYVPPKPQPTVTQYEFPMTKLAGVKEPKKSKLQHGKNKGTKSGKK
ncbi:MAG: hypothetical protein V1709_06710 [Planctomycetota bacterium]